MTDSKNSVDESRKPIRSFGRVRGRPLRPSQQNRLAQFEPDYMLPLPEKGQFIELEALFPDCLEFALEIGFGAGEHLLGQASKNPQYGFIGIEPFEQGYAKCLLKAAALGISNIRLYQGDVRFLLTALPAKSSRDIYILFPDPWPKKRHAKRRLLQPDFIAQIAEKMKSGGLLHIASDIADYVDFALFNILQSSYFEWQATDSEDWRNPPKGHITTCYEQKALREGRPPAYLTFDRRSTCSPRS